MKMPLISLILQGIPETIGLAALFHAMLKQKLVWKQLIFLGILVGIITYFIRLLPISPGVHTFILIIIWTGILRILTKKKLTKLFLVVFMGIAVLAVAEIVFNQILFSLLNTSYEDAMNQPVIWSLLGLPQVLLLFLLAFFLNRNNKTSLLFAKRQEKWPSYKR